MPAAYTVVCKDTDPCWLDERKKVLTASNVAAMLGEGYDSKAFFLAVQRGEIKPKDASPPMRSGKWEERPTMAKFSWITGIVTRPCNNFLVSNLIPGLGCTIDGYISRPDELPAETNHDATFPNWGWPEDFTRQVMEAPTRRGLIEIKASEPWGKKAWEKTDGMSPMYYWMQVQTQLHVTQLRWAVLCHRWGAHGMMAQYIPRDDAFEPTLRKAVEEYAAEMAL